MIDFKQFADKCLNGKLSGHFIVRSGLTIHSNRLQKLGFYQFTSWQYAYNETGECINGPHCWDIIKFKPNMSKENNKRNIQITLQQAKEWYNSGDNTLKTLALSSFDKLELDPYPKSWEEYLKANNHPSLQYTINQDGFVVKTFENGCAGDLNHVANRMKLYLPSKEYAEAFLAMMQLISLRQAWIKDWEPDWDGKMYYHCIMILDNKCSIDTFSRYYHPLSFPTREMAEDFMNCFKDLIEIAKPLI